MALSHLSMDLLQFLMQWFLSFLSFDWLLCAVALSVSLSLLGLLRIGSQLMGVLSNIEEALSFISQKVCYLEFRADRSQSTASDTLRHLVAKVSEFDCAIGEWSVLLRWISQERDHWLQRRSAASWLLLSQATQVQVLSEIVWLRITQGQVEANEVAAERQLVNLRYLSNVLPATKWHKLTSLEEVGEMPEDTISSDVPVYELLCEQVSHYRDFLRSLAVSMKVSWATVNEGLSLSEIFGSESRSSTT